MQGSMMEAKKLAKLPETESVKNLFFLMTCIACCNCIIRSDFNFAFGLLGYYMMKITNEKKMARTAGTVSNSS